MYAMMNRDEVAPRLTAATPNELSAVSGGTNMSLFHAPSRTGVIFNEGAVEWWDNGVCKGMIVDGKFKSC